MSQQGLKISRKYVIETSQQVKPDGLLLDELMLRALTTYIQGQYMHA